MDHYEARLRSRGQITIPVEIRDLLSLREGDRVDFYADGKTFTVRMLARNKTFADLLGIVKSRKRIKASDIDRWSREARASTRTSR